MIARGSLYLSREICEALFPGAESAALVARDRHMLIVPLIGASVGGRLLKQRNSRGDRVIHAPEFLRENGFPENPHPANVRARWSAESAALLVDWGE
jgi:hypothetical protein